MKLSLSTLAVAAFLALSAFAADAPRVLFEEKFSGSLSAGWRWMHERPDAWRLADGALVVDTLPGSYWQKQDSAQNTLLRPAPVSAKDGFIVEVLLENEPAKQYEHAGLILYFDSFNHVVFNKEFIGKQELFMVSAQDGNPAVGPAKAYRGREVWLRLVVRGTKATGFFRSSENEPWQKLDERTIPTSDREMLIGLHSGYGSDKRERQARFRKFRVLQEGE